MTNSHNSILYVGVTADLMARVHQHRRKEYKNSFTDRYNCHKLVYYEFHSRIEEAIGREKQLKNWTRAWKEVLINKANPDWNDLSGEI